MDVPSDVEAPHWDHPALAAMSAREVSPEEGSLSG